jgi:hypothetical protein
MECTVEGTLVSGVGDAGGSDRLPPCSRGPPIHVSSRCGLCLQGGSVTAAVTVCLVTGIDMCLFMDVLGEPIRRGK